MRKATFVLTLIVLLSLAACNGGGEEGDGAGNGATGDPNAGQTVYNEVASPTCASCHSLEPGVTLVGPSLANIGSEAANRESGTPAEDYIRQSITDPDAYVVEGFSPGIMPSYEGQLSEQQINDVVAFLMSQQ